MKTPRFPRSRRLGINMTPMIDVVFLLIIFFLVSNHLARQESLLNVDLPQAASAEADQADARQRLTLTVMADGQVFVGGQSIERPQLESRLAALATEDGRDVEIRIRASRDLPYQMLEPLIVSCAKKGFWRLTFAVYEPGKS